MNSECAVLVIAILSLTALAISTLIILKTDGVIIASTATAITGIVLKRNELLAKLRAR